MSLVALASGVDLLRHTFEMTEALKAANEKLQEGLEDQLRNHKVQANYHLAKAESDAEQVRKAIDAKIETLRKKDGETIQERKAVIDLKVKAEMGYQEKLNSLIGREAAILKKKIKNEDREDTSPEYKKTKLNNFISTLWIHACKELLDEVYKNGSDNAKGMRLQMAASTFNYYTLRMKHCYLAKFRAIYELGTVLDLDDNAPLCKVIPESFSCLEGIDIESAILRENFDESVTLELCQLNYNKNSDWLLALLCQSGSKFDFAKITSKEGYSALAGDFLTTLVTLCVKCPDEYLDKVPRYFSIGFCPSLDWESEFFELFKSFEQSMTLKNRNSASGALACAGDVKYNGKAMEIFMYFGFEEKEKPFKKINCFEMFRVPDFDNDTSE